METPHWEAAEDAFLALYCDLEPLPYGTRYTFADGNKRFNAIRVPSAEALAAVDWNALAIEQAPWFALRQKALTIQLPEPLVPPAPWVAVGSAYDHVCTPVDSFRHLVPSILRLRRCATDDDVETYVAIGLPAQIPPHLRERIARVAVAQVGRCNREGRLWSYLLEREGTPIGTVSCAPFTHGHTVLNLSVTPSHQGQGHMKHIYALLAENLEGDLYGQIEDGLATMGYRSRILGTARLARSQTWRHPEDPLFSAP